MRFWPVVAVGWNDAAETDAGALPVSELFTRTRARLYTHAHIHSHTRTHTPTRAFTMVRVHAHDLADRYRDRNR